MMVEFLCCHEILQIPMVRPYLNFMLCSFQEMAPLLQSSDNCQHLLVVNLIVPLNGIERLRVKRDRMPLSVDGRWLGKDSTGSKSELSASTRNGRESLGEASTGTDVTEDLSLRKADCSASPQTHGVLALVRSKRGCAWCEKS